MNKIYLLLLTVFLNLAFFSCNPTSLTDDALIEQADNCCDEEGDILPPPPPPPSQGGRN